MRTDSPKLRYLKGKPYAPDDESMGGEEGGGE
jgi:hypothetical protein